MASCRFLYNSGGRLGYRAQSSFIGLGLPPCSAGSPIPLTNITNCNNNITNCNMKLGDKLKYLREVEGTLRGLGRPMSQQEVTRLIKKESGKAISQSYLSQIESGARPHLTNSTRMLLARFFKVHPGYLVDDPEGYSTELVSDLGAVEDKLDLWLISGAERFSRDLGTAPRAVDGREAQGFAQVSDPARRDSRKPGPGRAVDSGAQAAQRKGGGAHDLGRFLSHLFFLWVSS